MPNISIQEFADKTEKDQPQDYQLETLRDALDSGDPKDIFLSFLQFIDSLNSKMSCDYSLQDGRNYIRKQISNIGQVIGSSEQHDRNFVFYSYVIVFLYMKFCEENSKDSNLYKKLYFAAQIYGELLDNLVELNKEEEREAVKFANTFDLNEIKVSLALQTSFFSLPTRVEELFGSNKALLCSHPQFVLKIRNEMSNARFVCSKRLEELKANHPINEVPATYAQYCECTYSSEGEGVDDFLYSGLNLSLEEVRDKQEENLKNIIAQQFIEILKFYIEHAQWKVHGICCSGTKVQLGELNKRLPRNIAEIYRLCEKAEKEGDFVNKINQIALVGRTAASKYPFFGKRDGQTQLFYDSLVQGFTEELIFKG